MLATAREVLAHARANQYAVPGFDCVEDVMVRAILETAEAHRAPVFMMCLVPVKRWSNAFDKVVGDRMSGWSAFFRLMGLRASSCKQHC